MIIRLTCDGITLNEVESDDINNDIFIGRGECTWRAPANQSMISGTHIKISKKGRKIELRDVGSKNGTFLNGKKIRSLRLKPGIIVSFGGCNIEVSQDESSSESHTIPTLTVRSGKRRNEEIEIPNEEFIIGSDSDANLSLYDDMLISGRHAKIITKIDGCYIEDLNSKNGTRVNGEHLTPKKERFLQNNDIIEAAHIELAFRDGSIFSHP